MNTTDWIGSIGVGLLLLAYVLNLKQIIQHNSLVYISLNIIGAMLACLASYLLNYIPFIVLETCWILVSLFGLFNSINTKQLITNNKRKAN